MELLSLHSEVWSRYDRAWVTLRKIDSEQLLESEQVYYAYGPTNRNYKNLAKNVWLALKVFYKERPTCVISSGAGLAIPFLYVGLIWGARTIYLESFARRRDLSLTGRVVYHAVHDFLVQSPDINRQIPKASYRGTVF